MKLTGPAVSVLNIVGLVLTFIGGLTAVVAFSVAGAIEGFGGASRGVWLNAFAVMLIGAAIAAIGIALFRVKRPDDPFGPPALVVVSG